MNYDELIALLTNATNELEKRGWQIEHIYLSNDVLDTTPHSILEYRTESKGNNLFAYAIQERRHIMTAFPALKHVSIDWFFPDNWDHPGLKMRIEIPMDAG